MVNGSRRTIPGYTKYLTRRLQLVSPIYFSMKSLATKGVLMAQLGCFCFCCFHESANLKVNRKRSKNHDDGVVISPTPTQPAKQDILKERSVRTSKNATKRTGLEEKRKRRKERSDMFLKKRICHQLSLFTDIGHLGITWQISRNLPRACEHQALMEL